MLRAAAGTEAGHSCSASAAWSPRGLRSLLRVPRLPWCLRGTHATSRIGASRDVVGSSGAAASEELCLGQTGVLGKKPRFSKKMRDGSSAMGQEGGAKTGAVSNRSAGQWRPPAAGGRSRRRR